MTVKKDRLVIGRAAPVVLEQAIGFRFQHDMARFAAFALQCRNLPAIAIGLQVFPLESTQFRDAQACAIEDTQDQLIARVRLV